MDERKTYPSFSIPRRETLPANRAAPPARAGALVSALDDGAGFVEIEYGTNINANRRFAGGNETRLFPSAAPAEHIEQRARDPIRERFINMRRLAKDRSFARDNSLLFYKQAKFMADFTDDFDGDAKLSIYYPYYQQMGYEQLRTYFTWRTKVRRGEILPTSASYAFLYVYELLNGIGAESSVDGLNKLVAIWDNFIKYGPSLCNYMPGWFKDYHIYYKLPHSFADFVKEHNLYEFYPEMFLFDNDIENRLEVWNRISDYIITQSTFYKAGNEQLLNDCFGFVLDSIQKLCINLNIQIEELFVYHYKRVGSWYPFKQALFYPWLRQPDRKVKMRDQENYTCKDNHWTAYLPIYYSDQKYIVGKVIKKMEACLREATKFKYKLKTEPCEFYRSSGTPIVFDGAIETAVADFINNKKRTVVVVDHANLARIREEAQGTQDKLLVPEEIAAAGENPDYPSSSAWLPRNSEFQIPNPGSAPPADGWSSLKSALTVIEIETISMALHGDTDIKTFADKNGIMPEVLVGGINEKAMDFIGDNILETDGGITVYDDYKESAAEMVKGLGAFGPGSEG